MYLNWKELTTEDFSDQNINTLYNEGFLFTRIKKGKMAQTRSVRIDLSKFKLSSENKRILRKTEDIELNILPIPYSDYNWKIGKMAKDFYSIKFGEGTFSANKIKELLTTKHNFNKLFVYKTTNCNLQTTECNVGFAICHETNELLSYSYPFYNLKSEINNLGISMMLRAIMYASESGKKYIYLGSAKDEKAKYKLQFEGLEWFDGINWDTDLAKLKNILK